MDQMRFDGRVVLITGAGRGMGQAHAVLLAARGAKVVVSDRGTDLFGQGGNASPAEKVVADIRKAGGEAIEYVADLSTEEGARGAVRAAVSAYGRLDVLVHNAGFTSGGMAFEHERLDRLDLQLAVNTRAAYCLIQEAWPLMIKQGYGRIILAASAAIHGIAGSIPYSAAKASYIGLVRGLATEGAPHGIKVNAIEPAGATRMSESMVESDFRTWFLRTMKPELVSAVVGFLGHEECAVSGEFLIAAGGRVARTVFADTVGYTNPALTMEDVKSHVHEVLEDRRYLFPKDGVEATALMATTLGFESGKALNIAGGAQASGGGTKA